MSDIQFIDGLSAKAPRSNAPEYVKASLSIKREALIAWLQQQEGEWVNADVKEAKSGKWYVAVDTWKPEGKRGEPKGNAPAPAPAGGFDDDDLPF